MCFKKLKIGDVVVYCFAAVLAFLPLFSAFASGGGTLSADIYMGGVLQKSMVLSNAQNYTIYGDYENNIVVSGGKISFASSTCPTQTCVHSGTISRAGQAIACLPNGVVVRIVGTKTDIDTVVG